MHNSSKPNKDCDKSECCKNECDQGDNKCCQINSNEGLETDKCKCSLKKVESMIKEEVTNTVDEKIKTGLVKEEIVEEVISEIKKQGIENNEILSKVKDEIKEEIKQETGKVTLNKPEEIKKESKSPFLTGDYPKTTTEAPVELKDDEYEEEQLGKLEKIFGAPCSMYRYNSDKGEYEQRGEGKIYIVIVPEKNLFKIMMIRSKVKRLGCNHYVSPMTTLTPHVKRENVWIWTTLNDTTEGDSKLASKQTYCVRFTDSDNSKLFELNFKRAQEHNGKILNNKNSP